METKATVFIMPSDGTVAPGDLAYVTIGSGESYLTKFSFGDLAHFYAVIGICHSIPPVNKIGNSNPVNICLKGKVKLSMANTSGWTVGDSIFLDKKFGNVWNQSGISSMNWYETKRLGVVVGIETDTYLELFIDGM